MTCTEGHQTKLLESVPKNTRPLYIDPASVEEHESHHAGGACPFTGQASVPYGKPSRDEQLPWVCVDANKASQVQP